VQLPVLRAPTKVEGTEAIEDSMREERKATWKVLTTGVVVVVCPSWHMI